MMSSSDGALDSSQYDAAAATLVLGGNRWRQRDPVTDLPSGERASGEEQDDEDEPAAPPLPEIVVGDLAQSNAPVAVRRRRTANSPATDDTTVSQEGNEPGGDDDNDDDDEEEEQEERSEDCMPPRCDVHNQSARRGSQPGQPGGVPAAATPGLGRDGHGQGASRGRWQSYRDSHEGAVPVEEGDSAAEADADDAGGLAAEAEGGAPARLHAEDVDVDVEEDATRPRRVRRDANLVADNEVVAEGERQRKQRLWGGTVVGRE